MNRRTEILTFINYLYESWLNQPDLSFSQLLKHCCGDEIPNNDIDLARQMGEQIIRRQQQERSEKTKEPVDWTPVKQIIENAMNLYEFPAAEPKQDHHGVEYWDEGYRFDESHDRLILDYRPGLDISPTAMERVKFRQEICNNVMDRLMKATLGWK